MARHERPRGAEDFAGRRVPGFWWLRLDVQLSVYLDFFFFLHSLPSRPSSYVLISILIIHLFQCQLAAGKEAAIYLSFYLSLWIPARTSCIQMDVIVQDPCRKLGQAYMPQIRSERRRVLRGVNSQRDNCPTFSRSK